MKTLGVWMIAVVGYLQFETATGVCCPDKWIPYKSHCYWVGYGEYMTFSKAIEYCTKRDAYLVRLDSFSENWFLKDLLRKTRASKTWTSLSDQTYEGIWMWYGTTEYAGFSDWKSGEPNNHLGNEDCVHFYGPDIYEWNDAECTEKFQPLCEFL